MDSQQGVLSAKVLGSSPRRPTTAIKQKFAVSSEAASAMLSGFPCPPEEDPGLRIQAGVFDSRTGDFQAKRAPTRVVTSDTHCSREACPVSRVRDVGEYDLAWILQ